MGVEEGPLGTAGIQEQKLRVLLSLRWTVVWSGQKGPPWSRRTRRSHEGSTKKTYLDKHLCGLANRKSIGRTRKRESARKPLSCKIHGNDFTSCSQDRPCVLTTDRTPNYKRLTWVRTFNAEPEQSEGSPLEQVVELRPVVNR